MNLTSTIRVADGPLTVSVLGSDDRLWASIDIADTADLRLYGADDCDRLITAATTAKRMLETGTRPHAYEPGAGGYGSDCARCGRVKGRDVHAAPCPSVSPDGDACTVAEPGHAWHYGPDEGGGVRRMWDDADAVAALAPGQAGAAPASAGECGGTWLSATDTTWYCTRDAGHDGRHRAMAGDDLCAEWDDANGTEYAPAGAPETGDAR